MDKLTKLKLQILLCDILLIALNILSISVPIIVFGALLYFGLK